MKKSLMILLAVILILITGCDSPKLKPTEKFMEIYNFDTGYSYASRDESEIAAIVTAINSSKKAPSKYVKKVKGSDLLKPADYNITFINKGGKVIFGINVDGENILTSEENSGNRLIEDKDVKEFIRILSNATKNKNTGLFFIILESTSNLLYNR